jgi:hypothetical protein
MDTPQHPDSNEIGSAASRIWEELATPEPWSEGHLARWARRGPKQGRTVSRRWPYRLEPAGERTRLTVEDQLGSGLAPVAARSPASDVRAGSARSSGYGTPQSSGSRPPA